MPWHDFVFSNQAPLHRRRHLVFWLLWLMYIVFTLFFTQKPSGPLFHHHQLGLPELGYFQYSLLVLLKSVLLLLTHLFFCYTVVYFLLPNYLLKKKYLRMLASVLLLSALSITLGYFLYALLYPSVDGLFGLHLSAPTHNILWTSISAGLIGSIKVTLIAIAITLLKRWWLKQKAKEKLEREKITIELQLLKAQIHPVFLFSTLTNIIDHARSASPKAPEMLIKLSDLLSYMLYECDVPVVMLEKEINMIRDYMELEKTRQGEKLEMTVQINGAINGQMISPLILIPFIDYSLFYCNKERIEQAWINLDITVTDKNLSMKLINGMPVLATGDKTNGDTGRDVPSLANVQKRLELLYPARHELKINIEQELLIVYLNLKLEEVTPEHQTEYEIINPAVSYAGI